jgi:hypothetical protein
MSLCQQRGLRGERIQHTNREVIHHGAEIGLLRDLYRAKGVANCCSFRRC